MGYKWKPSAAQRSEYRQSIEAAPRFICANGAIRTGCRVSFYDVPSSLELTGIVERHSYGSDRGQHTFSIRLVDGSLKLIKGRNLYPRLTAHAPAAESVATF